MKKEIESYLKEKRYFKVIDMMNQIEFEISPYKIKVVENSLYSDIYDLHIDHSSFETLYHINTIKKSEFFLTLKDINDRKIHLLPIYLNTTI